MTSPLTNNKLHLCWRHYHYKDNITPQYLPFQHGRRPWWFLLGFARVRTVMAKQSTPDGPHSRHERKCPERHCDGLEWRTNRNSWETDSKDMARKYLKRQCDGRALKEQELQDFFQNKMILNVLEPINRLQLFVCLLIITAQSKLLSSKAPHKPILCRPHVFTQRSEAWRQSYKAVEERLASRKARPLGTPSRIGLREASFRAVLFEIGKTRS